MRRFAPRHADAQHAVAAGGRHAGWIDVVGQADDAAEAAVDFVDPKHHDHPVALGRLPDRSEIVGVEIYSILQQTSVDLAGEVVVVRVPRA